MKEAFCQGLFSWPTGQLQGGTGWDGGWVRSCWNHILFLLGPFLSIPHLTQTPKMLWQLDLGPALPEALGAARPALSHPAPPCPAVWKVMFPSRTAGGMGASRRKEAV